MIALLAPICFVVAAFWLRDLASELWTAALVAVVIIHLL